MNPYKLYLTQTDTTVGFVSKDKKKIAKAKKRDENQPSLICVDSFCKLNQLTRIPKLHKKRVRRSSKTTFLYPNKKAIRVVTDTSHGKFLKEFDFLYSSSANKSGDTFDYDYAFKQADIIVEDKRGLFKESASCILKLTKRKIDKLR